MQRSAEARAWCHGKPGLSKDPSPPSPGSQAPQHSQGTSRQLRHYSGEQKALTGPQISLAAPHPPPPAFTHTQGFLEQCRRVIPSHGTRAPDVTKEHRSLFLAGGVISIARPSQAGRNGSCATSLTKADLFLSGTVGEAPNQAGVISPPLPQP